MSAAVSLVRAADFLKANDHYLILSHRRPDGDTVGSCAALCMALRAMGKQAWVYPNAQFTPKFAPWLEGLVLPPAESAISDSQFTILSCDIASRGLFPFGAEDFPVALALDHHGTNDGFAALTHADETMAACGEILVDLLPLLGVEMTRPMAEAIYIAVSTDCGCFQYANTSARTLRAAAELLEAGADNRALNLRFFRRISRARMQLEGMIYSGMGFYHDGLVTVAIITRDMLRETGATEEDLDDLAGLAGKAENSILSITIRERPDGSSRVSARSNPEISSSELCAVFGGGGHAMAAGCTIQAPPEKAREMLLAVVDELMRVRGQA